MTAIPRRKSVARYQRARQAAQMQVILGRLRRQPYRYSSDAGSAPRQSS